MKHLKTVLAGLGTLALAGSLFAAQASKPAPKPTATPTKTSAATPAIPARTSRNAAAEVKEAKGRVVSADATSLVISQTIKGKSQEKTFVLNPETQKSGQMEPGTAVTVKYRMENGENVATAVHVSAGRHYRHHG